MYTQIKDDKERQQTNRHCDDYIITPTFQCDGYKSIGIANVNSKGK